MANNIETIRAAIKTIDDFPKKGIKFYNVLSLFADQKALAAFEEEAARELSKYDFNKIAGLDARGLIFAAYLGRSLKKDMVFFRKAGKLPPPTISAEYEYEYASATLEATTDCIKKGDKVLIIDDVLATGNTIKASADLVKRLGGEVAGAFFLLEIDALNGAKNIEGFDYSAVLSI